MTRVPETTAQALGARIDTLEMRVAYQDQVIEDLNNVIVGHWNRFDQLQGQIARLETRIREGQDNAGRSIDDEPPPPHY